MAGYQQNEDSRCSDTIVEDGRSHGGIRDERDDLNSTSVPAERGSLAEVEVSSCSPDTTPPLDEFPEERASSEESFDFYDGDDFSQSDGDNDGSDISSLSGGVSGGGGEQMLPSPTEIRHEEVPHRESDDRLPGQPETEGLEENDEETEDGGKRRIRKKPEEKRNSSSSSRRRREKQKNAKKYANDGGSGTATSTGLDEAWPNRWLTGNVLLNDGVLLRAPPTLSGGRTTDPVLD